MGEVTAVDLGGVPGDGLGVLDDELEGLALQEQPRVAGVGQLRRRRARGPLGLSGRRPGAASLLAGRRGLAAARRDGLGTPRGGLADLALHVGGLDADHPASSRAKASTFERSRMLVTSLAASRMASMRPSARSRS